MPEAVMFDLDIIAELTRDVSMANGADRDNAEAVSETVTKAGRDFALSHGLFRVPGCVAALRSGKVN